MRITSAGITNVGMKRQNNEDNYLINDAVGIYVCCCLLYTSPSPRD